MKLIVLIMLMTLSSFAQNLSFESIYRVEIKASNSSERSAIANFVHIDEFYEKSVVAYTNYEDLISLRKNFAEDVFFSIELDLPKYDSLYQKPTPYFFEFPRGFEAYHTYDEVNERLKKLAKRYPRILQVVELGNSFEGRKILGMKMTLGGFQNELQKPALMMMGSHHAREHLSTEIPLLLIEEYIKLIPLSDKFKDLLNKRVLYIFPLINPDGALHDIKGQRFQMWRKNRRPNKGTPTFGVDLNRNYDNNWGMGGSSKNPASDVYMGKAPFSEPETIAVKEFVETHPNIKTMISFHTFSKLILYPYGGLNDEVEGKDGVAFKKLAEKMATWNGYKPMKSSGLYIATGDTCDWAYDKHNIFCFTFELDPATRRGGGFYPGVEQIEKTLRINIKPTVFLLNLTADPLSIVTDDDMNDDGEPAPTPRPNPPGPTEPPKNSQNN